MNVFGWEMGLDVIHCGAVMMISSAKLVLWTSGGMGIYSALYKVPMYMVIIL